MEYAWTVPIFDYVKINVHCVSREAPLPNGNTNGVGVIIRDSSGSMLWGQWARCKATQ